MQSDEDVGKVAAPVPVIISRALELFAETLLKKANNVTNARGARTLTPSHLKFCIHSEARFDFLRDTVSSVPDLQGDLDCDLQVASSLPSPAVAVDLQLGAPPLPPSSRGRGRGGGGPDRPSGRGTGRPRGRPRKNPEGGAPATPGGGSPEKLRRPKPQVEKHRKYMDDPGDASDGEGSSEGGYLASPPLSYHHHVASPLASQGGYPSPGGGGGYLASPHRANGMSPESSSSSAAAGLHHSSSFNDIRHPASSPTTSPYTRGPPPDPSQHLHLAAFGRSNSLPASSPSPHLPPSYSPLASPSSSSPYPHHRYSSHQYSPAGHHSPQSLPGYTTASSAHHKPSTTGINGSMAFSMEGFYGSSPGRVSVVQKLPPATGHGGATTTSRAGQDRGGPDLDEDYDCY